MFKPSRRSRVVILLSVAAGIGLYAQQSRRDGVWVNNTERAVRRPAGVWSATTSSEQPEQKAGRPKRERNPNARQLTFEGDKPIASRLLPSDSQVEMWIASDESFASAESGTAAASLERKTRNADFVAIVQVSAVSGRLNTKADWIKSSISARIDTVLKNSSVSPQQTGGTIVFEVDGGEVTIGKARVRGVNEREFPMEVSHRYLCFFIEHEGRLITDAMHTFDVTTERLERLYHRPLGEVDGTLEDWAKGEISAKAGLPKLRPGEVVR
jgi:hypothetical protein